MSSIDKIHMLKRILKEALNIKAWQTDIYTDLHNIDASWIVSGTLAWDRMPFDTWAELLAKLTKDVGDYLNLASLQIGGIEVITALRVLQNVTADAGIITSGVFDVARIPNLDASKITSGRFPLSRLPYGSSGYVIIGQGAGVDPTWGTVSGISGTITNAQHGTKTGIPNAHHTAHYPTLADHPLSIIPTMDDAHIPNVETLSYGGTFATAQIPNLDTSKITTGVFDLARIPNIDWGRISANFPRTIADLLSDHDLAHHPLNIIPTMDLAHIPTPLTGKDADTVDGYEGVDLAEIVASKTVAELGTFFNDAPTDEAPAGLLDAFPPSFGMSILTHANLSANKTQSIMYAMPLDLRFIEVLTDGAGDLTVSSDTSISGVNRYDVLTVNSGITLTVTGQPGAIIARRIINEGTIAKSPTGGAGGTAGATGAGAGGQGGGGLIIFAERLEGAGDINANGAAGGNGSTITTDGDAGAGGSGVFYRVGTHTPGTGGYGAYDSIYTAYRGDGGVNGGGGGAPAFHAYAGDGDGSTLTTFTFPALADEIRKSVIDWVIMNVIGKSPTSTVDVPNVYGSGGGGGGAGDTYGACGGGGAGGGEILVLCFTLDITGTIRANGGVGGNGGTEGLYDNEGGGGGGGLVYIFYKLLSGTLQANGGAAGTGDSEDTAGAAGGNGVATSDYFRGG